MSIGVGAVFPDDTISVITIDGSTVTGVTNTIRAEGGYRIRVGASKLDGGVAAATGTGSEIKCAGVHDENYTFSASTCP